MRRGTVLVVVAVLSSAVLSGVSGASSSPSRDTSGSTRPSVNVHRVVGRISAVKLVRVVDAAKLPKPLPHPPYNPEPKETQPVTGPPRTVGVVGLVQGGKVIRPGAAGVQGELLSVKPRFSETRTATGLGRGVPPDTQLAVSSKWVVEFVNSSGEVWNHSGTSVATYDLGSLFSGVAGSGSDPKIVYDASSGDFFASYISSFVRTGGASEVDIAVAKDPTGTWDVYDVHNESILQDQPKLGVSSDKVTIAWNDNGNSGPEEFKVIQKAQLVAGADSASGVIWGPDSTRLNVVPAVQLSSSTTAYAVFHNYNSSTVGLLAFTGVPGVSPTSYAETDVSVAATSAPPAAAQPSSTLAGPSLTLDTGDDRLESAVWYEGVLWTAGNDVCKSANDTASRACLKVVQITTSPVKLVRDVDITLVGGSVMYPAVTMDTRKDLWIAFSSSSHAQFASSEIAEVPGGKIGSTVASLVYHSGTGANNYDSKTCTTPPDGPPERFGDYSGIGVDPAVGDRGVWAATEYGVAGCGTGTEIGAFTS